MLNYSLQYASKALIGGSETSGVDPEYRCVGSVVFVYILESDLGLSDTTGAIDNRGLPFGGILGGKSAGEGFEEVFTAGEAEVLKPLVAKLKRNFIHCRNILWGW